MNRFSFWGVGQGLFYTGILRNGAYKFVYDCGGESLAIARDAVNEFYQDCEFNRLSNSIDFVMFSHLHLDHYIGLYELSQRFRINKIYLPYISSDEDVIRTVLTFEIFGRKKISKKSRDYDTLDKLLSYMLAIYGIFDDSIPLDGLPTPLFLGKKSEEDSELVIGNKRIWQFVMINKHVDQMSLRAVTDGVKALLDANGGIGLKEFLLTDKKNVTAVRKIYDGIIGRNQNIATTILLHYPLYALKYNCAGIYKYQDEFRFDLPITILTGDADIDDEAYRRIGVETWGYRVYVFQVPHHGALKSWLQVKRFFDFVEIHNYVISYGLGNKYKHPSPEVIRDIKDGFYPCLFADQLHSVKYWID